MEYERSISTLDHSIDVTKDKPANLNCTILSTSGLTGKVETFVQAKLITINYFITIDFFFFFFSILFLYTAYHSVTPVLWVAVKLDVNPVKNHLLSSPFTYSSQKPPNITATV